MTSGIYNDPHITIRVSKETLGELQKDANRLGQTISGLIRVILERYTASRREHGDRLVWPPRFAHFAPSAEPWDDRLGPACPPGTSHCEESNPARPTPGRRSGTVAGGSRHAGRRTGKTEKPHRHAHKEG